jgi:hypothetical protein
MSVRPDIDEYVSGILRRPYTAKQSEYNEFIQLLKRKAPCPIEWARVASIQQQDLRINNLHSTYWRLSVSQHMKRNKHVAVPVWYFVRYVGRFPEPGAFKVVS